MPLLLTAFRALAPPPALARRLAVPPYDVVSSAEARLLAAGNPHSFFRISRPEVDLPEGVEEHAPAVYARGAENLRRFRAEGWLLEDAVEGFRLYRQKMGEHVQTGVVACASLDGYRDGRIKRHELTRADKEDDRTRHIDALGANDEPVFLTYRAQPTIDTLVDALTAAAPEVDFASEDGVRHTVWQVVGEEAARLSSALALVPTLYIADGHHRSAAAARVQQLRPSRGAEAGERDRFLAVVFPHDQMQILPYHRVVRDLGGLDAETFLASVRERFDVTLADRAEPEGRHAFGMYFDGRWWRLRARAGSWKQTPTASLDVAILQENLLRPALGIEDPRRDGRIDFVGGIRGTRELSARVDGGLDKVAFALWPTSLDELMAISDAGETMPPKSTWFEPKLRSGLFLHPF
ncbi:MAG: DUF1015 domain-containing protein [Myxococcaceae bacterium]